MLVSLKRVMILISIIFSCSAFAANEFDLSYSPLLNGGAENGLDNWLAQNCNQVNTGSFEGDYCFQLAPDNKSAILVSDFISVLPNEKFRIRYNLKTDPNKFSKSYTFTLKVKSYASDKHTVLKECVINLETTDWKWAEYSHDFVSDSKAFYVNLNFEYTKVSSSEKKLEPFYLDNIKLFREINHPPMYGDIKPLSPGDTLYTYKAGTRRGGNKSIAIQTIQGITARNSHVRVWIDTGDQTYVNLFSEKYKIKFDNTYAEDFPGLLAQLKPYTSGTYVLYDQRDRPSVSAATTMAGLLDAVAIDTSLEETAIEKGYTLALDVRGKDCRWVYNNYREQLNHNAIIVHTNNYREHPSVACLRDMGPALKAIDWWYKDEQLSRAVYRSMAPCSPVYGWQDPISSDEGVTVQIHSQEGLFQMPSDWMLNLSVHAALGASLKDKGYSQIVSRQAPQPEKGVHYVTFIMSDMDNILTEIGPNSFYSSKKFYANEDRGKFPMSWGMAPSLAELSPAAIDMWYSHAKPDESFVGYCGLGYFYPSEAPYMQTHMDRLSKFMKRADLKTLLLIDRLQPARNLSDKYYDYAKWFTSIDDLSGLFYMEYIEYAPYDGKIYWFDGKPMVTARFDFRSEEFYSAVRSTPQKLADSINSLPKDPSNPDSYTFVTVHAWSKGVTDIYETVKLLDPDVRVVHAEKFIELIRLNLKGASRNCF